MEKKIYMADLCYYTEENIPECGATIFIRSEDDLTSIPRHELKENIFIQEALEEAGCEGIINVFKISDKDFEEYYKDENPVLIEI